MPMATGGPPDHDEELPDDLKAKAIGALRRLQKLPHLVRGFFADPHLRYITA